MSHIKKLFFVPVGLPGMGKTTLAKHLEHCKHKQFVNFEDSRFTIIFKKISYDRMLTDNQKAFQAKHPDVPFHECIDIIRGQADKQYLDAITNCFDDAVEKENQGHKTNQHSPSAVGIRELIYLDRNNTADIWSDVS